MARYVAAFEDLGRVGVAVAGGKGANLGEMTRAGLPVPPGPRSPPPERRLMVDAARSHPESEN